MLQVWAQANWQRNASNSVARRCSSHLREAQIWEEQAPASLDAPARPSSAGPAKSANLPEAGAVVGRREEERGTLRVSAVL